MKKLLQDNFERIYCINLDERPDRWAECQEEFKKYNKEHLIKSLSEAKIAFGVLNEIKDLKNHPQLRKIKCKIGDEEIELIAPPEMSLNQEQIIKKIPKIGENTIKIKKEFCF